MDDVVALDPSARSRWAARAPAWTARLAGYEALTLLDDGRSPRTPGLLLAVDSVGA